MTFVAPLYPDLVRDLLTTLTGGTATEAHPVPSTGLTEVRFDKRPAARVSHCQGTVELDDGSRIDYRFSERDFDYVPAEGAAPGTAAYDGLRFGKNQVPAPNSLLTVNYYPVRLRSTPVNDVNVGSVARTMLETVAHALATQYQQLGKVYDSAFVDTATGSGLDNVTALVDVRRLRRRHPVGKVRASRRAGAAGLVTIPIDTAVTDGAGNRYLTTDPATLLPGQTTVEVWVHGESPATEVVGPGTLVVLERALAGVDRVTNDEATYRATEDETDDQLRQRARVAVHRSGRGTLEAIRSGLEALEFVSAVSLAERPAGVPGTLQVNIALTEDTAFTRRLVTDRVTALRPAGIEVTTGFAGRVQLSLDVGLTLAGAFEPDSVLDEVRDGVRSRLEDAARQLAPGGTLRRARLLSTILDDERIVDATLAVAVDGTAVTGDTYTLPADRAIQLDRASDITFQPVAFEDGDAGGPALVPVDVELSITLTGEGATVASAESRARTLLDPALGSAVQLTVDTVQTALAAETAFVALAADTVVSVEHRPGEFVELRGGDQPFTPPVGATFELRRLDVTEAGA